MNFLLLFLLGVAETVVYLKLTSLVPSTLTSNDYLISTLGHFRLTLNSQTCQLQIETFTNNNYAVVGYYPRTVLSSCSSLTVANNSLVSNNGYALLSLRNAQLGSRFDQVFVTIDEMAIVRIDGVYTNQYQTSQNWISIFRSPQQYIYSISNLSVTIYHSLSFIQNSGNWGFSATQGQLRIFRVDDPSKITRYNYTAFTMTPGNLFDYNSNSFPYADFKNFKYKSKCTNSQNVVFQGPFTFAVNPYWPELRLLDQNGYQIVSVRYPDPNCTSYAGINYVSDNSRCLSWFCPESMFEHNGQCVTSCPSPYFHQIEEDGINRCVLNCEASHQKDSLIRVCSCRAPSLYQCPSTDLKATPLGCLCPKGTYYNQINKKSSNNTDGYCLSNCGPYLFNHPDGLCVHCPRHCLTCSLSSNSYFYLKCLKCQPGFSPTATQGRCLKTCNSSLGKTVVDGLCQNCLIDKCSNCSEGIYTCSSCSPPYSLFNSTCVSTYNHNSDNCPKGYKLVFKKDQQFQCQLINQCPSGSQQTYSVNNQSECFCLNSNRKTTFTHCKRETINCSLSEYYDSNTGECLSCPISCLTCALDSQNKIECTSCRPSYSLFLTITKNSYCQRNSLLSYCPYNYSKQEQICSVSSFQTVVVNRNRCFKQLTNCLACLPGSESQCSFCEKGFYLSKGTCFKECPNGTYQYRFQRVCLQNQLSACLEQNTAPTFWEFTRSVANQNADSFAYLLSVNFQLPNAYNDPIGSIFIYSFRGMTNTEVQPRIVNIAYSEQQCLVCQIGYGLSSRGLCQPCPSPCLQCIYSTSAVYSCLRCDEYHRLVNSSCIQLDPTEMPCQQGQFRNESFICQKQCLNFYRPNYIMTDKEGKMFNVNCTLNCPTDYSINSRKENNTALLLCSGKQKSQDEWVKIFGAKSQLSGMTIYLFITSKRLYFLSKNVATVKTVSSSRLLQTNTGEVQLLATQLGFIIVDKNGSFSNKPLVLDLNPAQIQTTQGVSLGNSRYGYEQGTKSSMDIIYNSTGNLYMYGRALTVILFIAAILFLGQHLSYKVDNLFITFNVIYLVLPSLNLTPSSSTFNVYSFLYGFAWSNYLEMLSNPRSLSQNSNWFNSYLDRPNNNAHYVLFVDNNILRNCWSIILFLIITVGILMLFICLFKSLSVSKQRYGVLNSPIDCLKTYLYQWKRVGMNHQDFDHHTTAYLLLIFFIQNSFTALSYYSLMNLFNPEWQLASADRLGTFKIISALFLVSMIGYTILRWYANRIAGIYCFKRIAFGCILGLLSTKGGIDDNLGLGIGLFIFQQLLFLYLRYRYELISDYLTDLNQKDKKHLHSPQRPKQQNRFIQPQPIQNDKTKQNSLSNEVEPVDGKTTEKHKKIWMVVEEIGITFVLIFLMLANTAKQVSVAFIWLLVTIWMMVIGLEFLQLLLDFYQTLLIKSTKRKQHKPYIKQIRNIYDHDLSLKSLAQTTDFWPHH